MPDTTTDPISSTFINVDHKLFHPDLAGVDKPTGYWYVFTCENGRGEEELYAVRAATLVAADSYLTREMGEDTFCSFVDTYDHVVEF